jgi:hypothetical protein
MDQRSKMYKTKAQLRSRATEFANSDTTKQDKQRPFDHPLCADDDTQNGLRNEQILQEIRPQ